MIITLGQARKAIAEYAGKAGKCPDSEDVRLFVLEVIQRLLHRGAHGNLRKWVFCLCKGCFTAPDDMEVPMKVKIDGFPENVWSKWYEFYDVHNSDLCDDSFQGGLIEEVNTYFTAYDLPAGGGRLAAIPLDTESDTAMITIQGLDSDGKEIFTTCNGCRIHGERILISRENPTFSINTFTKITGIEKSLTCNYVRLYWQKFDTALENITGRGLLAEYKPTDTHPSYRRFRVPAADCTRCVKVTILGRVKDIEYRHNNDILPITNFAALRRTAQLIHAEANEKLDVAVYQEQAIERTIEDENQYYKTGQEPFDFVIDTSPGAIKNLQ